MKKILLCILCSVIGTAGAQTAPVIIPAYPMICHGSTPISIATATPSGCITVWQYPSGSRDTGSSILTNTLGSYTVTNVNIGTGSSSTTPVLVQQNDTSLTYLFVTSAVATGLTFRSALYADTAYVCPTYDAFMGYGPGGGGLWWDSSIVWNGSIDTPYLPVTTTGWYAAVLTDRAGCVYQDSMYIVLDTACNLRVIKNSSYGDQTVSGPVSNYKIGSWDIHNALLDTVVVQKLLTDIDTLRPFSNIALYEGSNVLGVTSGAIPARNTTKSSLKIGPGATITVDVYADCSIAPGSGFSLTLNASGIVPAFGDEPIGGSARVKAQRIQR